jgi:hypothetical protein
LLLSRRAALRGGAGTVIALPLLEAMTGGRRAAAQARGPKRFVVFGMTMGTFPERFWPIPPGAKPLPAGALPKRGFRTGMEAADIDLRDWGLDLVTAPLLPHKKDLLFVEGTEQQKGQGPGHSGYCNRITGTRGDYKGTGISLDQAIANAIGKETKFPSLQMGPSGQGTLAYGCLSWYGPDRPASPEPNSGALFARLFSDLAAGDPRQAAAIDQLRLKRRSILDGALGHATLLRARLGSADRAKLDAYLASIRDVEGRIDKAAAAGGVTGCRKPDQAPRTFARKERTLTPENAAAQADILALAFACDLSRVATFLMSFEGGSMTYDWLGVPVGRHGLSHVHPYDAGAAAAWDQVTKVGAWEYGVMAGLIDRLKAIPEGNGTVFDNTLILNVNGLTYGCFHSQERSLVLLAGTAGGYFRSGRLVRYAQASPPSNNDVWVQILRAYGVDARTFGAPEFNKVSLDNLRG